MLEKFYQHTEIKMDYKDIQMFLNFFYFFITYIN